MNFKRIAILTSPGSWFLPYAVILVRILKRKGFAAKLFNKHEDIPDSYDIVFILSYMRLIAERYLKKHVHNLVVHESDLPRGRGWAPLFWQVLEGKNRIPIVIFEASGSVDAGVIYLKDNILLKGDELYDEIRKKQADKTIELCIKFLKDHKKLKPIEQSGVSTHYRRRTAADNELDLNKSIAEQFNLLRVSNNVDFPAFFRSKGRKYIVKISKEGKI